MELNRRVLIGGGLAATAVGVGRTAAASPAPPGRRTFTLTGSDLRLSGAGGGVPTVGTSALASASLQDQLTGAPVGVHVEYRAIASPHQVGESSPTSMETHHFLFEDGSIVGTGVATYDDNEDTFAVIGGTGRFAEARGSYSALQQHRGLGGDGSAVYRFTLTHPGA